MSNSEDHKRLTAFTLRILGEIGGLIAVPAIVFTSFARWLDARLGTRSIITIIALLASFFISMVAVSMRAAGYADRYDELTGDHDRGPPPRGKTPGQ